MPKKTQTPTLPLITSSFALLDVMKGRAALEKVVAAGYKIPVYITGYIQNGASGVGGDDGVSREFSIDVEAVVMEDPIFVPTDTHGRPWALVDDLKAGDKITLDGGFTCLSIEDQKKPRTVKEDKDGQLYFSCCGDGHDGSPPDGARAKQKHHLEGQLGEHGEYIGVYKVTSRK